MQRMLYPRNRTPGSTPSLLPATVVTTANGQTISGRLAYRDEFTITIVDANGWSHSIPAATVKKIEGDDPLREQWFGGGADHPGIHSVCVDPRDAKHVTVGVSCGGVWSTTDGGRSWQITGHGMRCLSKARDTLG